MAAAKTLVLPTPDKMNEILQELGTSEAKIDVDVKTVAEWMRKQPHLPDPEGKVRRLRSISAVVVGCRFAPMTFRDKRDAFVF